MIDVRDAEAVGALPKAGVAAHGGCHILVNNAEVTSAESFEAEALEDLHCRARLIGRLAARL